MDQNQIAAMYRQTGARGSNPVGLVVKLYEAILEDLRRASEALTSENVESRTRALNHALLIIAELEGVLDQERGGPVAQQLRGFYGVTRAMIVEANAYASREKIEKLMELFIPLKQAWQVVELDLAKGKIKLSGDSGLTDGTPTDSSRSRIQVPKEPDMMRDEQVIGWKA